MVQVQSWQTAITHCKLHAGLPFPGHGLMGPPGMMGPPLVPPPPVPPPVPPPEPPSRHQQQHGHMQDTGSMSVLGKRGARDGMVEDGEGGGGGGGVSLDLLLNKRSVKDRVLTEK